MGFLRRNRRPSGTTHNGGLAQIGLWFQEAYYDVWALNMVKQSLGFFPNTPANTNWPALYNADGYPTALPTGGTWSISQLYVYGAPGDVWVADWEGADCTIALTAAWTGGTFPEDTGARTSNRREYTITGNPVGTETTAGVASGPGGVMKVTATVSAIGTGFGNVRLYPKAHESLVNGSGATSMFTPAFLARTEPYGSDRYMDWARCNTSRLYKWDYRNTESCAIWSGPKNNGAWYYGAATVSSPKNLYTLPNTLPTLTNGIPIQWIMPSRPARRVVKSVTTGATTNLEITSHGYVTGDRVHGIPFNDGGTAWSTAFQTKSPTTGLPPDFEVTRVDDDNITITLNTSSGYSGGNAPNTKLTMTGLSSVSGTFSVGEIVTGGTTGSTGTVVSFSGTTLVLDQVSGDYFATETLTGGASGATAVLGSGSNTSAAFMVMGSVTITDGSVTKRVYRKGLGNHTYSEFGGKTYPFLYTAVYDSLFDCYVMSGDGEGDQFYVGSPISVMVAHANYCRANPYFTFPFMCDDDFFTQASTEVRATLFAGLKSRWSGPGNEIWNTGTNFWQTNYAQSLAIKMGWVSTAGVTAWDLAYAYRFNGAQAAIQAVFGTGDDWEMILEGQQGSFSLNRLRGNASINGGSSAGYPGNKADFIASAPYTSPIFGGNSGNAVNYPGLLNKIDDYNQGGASRTAAFEWLTDEMETASTLGWKAFPQTLDDCIASVATQATQITSSSCVGRRGTGLLQTHYESGPTQFTSASFNFTGFPANAPTSGRSVTQTNLQNFWLDWLASDAAGDYIDRHFTRMAAAGIITPSLYVIAGRWSFTSNQGLYKLNDVFSSPIPAITALLNWNNGN